MPKSIFKALAIGLISLQAEAYTFGTELTGDTKYACEALLCLSTSSRPTECSGAIKRYFSIKMKKPHDTAKARLNFLNKCPTNTGVNKEMLARIGLTEEAQEDGLAGLTEAIANLPYDCTPESLNKQVEQRKICVNNDDCKQVYRIKPTLPKACESLASHKWTAIALPVYKGDRSWSEAIPTKPVWFLK